MATRNNRAAAAAAAAPQPANRGAARIAGKQKEAAAAGRPHMTRQALGDIGNVAADVLDGKIKLPEGINRPITRSFGAKLLKDAALANKNAVAPAKPVAAPAVRKLARKVPPKNIPRPQQAPMVNRKPSQGAAKVPVENRKTSEGATGTNDSSVQKIKRNKKKVCTLSTVLSARSKVACGLTQKPKPVIEDIDKFDGNNQLAMVEYIEDIYTFYKTAQHENRPIDYIGNQPEINHQMRVILTDWLTEIHQRFELMPETLYLAVYILDMFLSLQPVPRRELQLIGAAAMLIACKYEEVWAPEVSDLLHISDGAFDRDQILGAEKAILNSMEWNLTVPTPYHFLLRFAKAAGSTDNDELQHMIFFFGELALMNYGMVAIHPSLVAACAVYSARLTLRMTPLWTETLKHHTGLHEQQLLEGAKMLVRSHAAAPDAKQTAVYHKYATEAFGTVARRPPAVLPDLV